MNIQQFNYVLAVLEYKNFELAAEKCFVTQSTLSTMISKFEDELGFKIFDRTKKPVVLTREGEGVIEKLRFISNGIDHLKEFSNELKGEVSGSLSLSAIPTLAPFLLPLFLKEFAKKFPKLVIKVREQTTEEIIRAIKLRDLDIGIVSTPLHEKELREVHLYNEPLMLFDFRSRYKKKVNAAKIETDQLFLLEEGHCLTNQILSFCKVMDSKTKTPKKNTSRPKIESKTISNLEFKAGSIDSLIRFVKANNGATLLPYMAGLDLSQDDKKHLHNFTSPGPYRSVGLVVSTHFARNRVLKELEVEIKSSVSKIFKKNLQSGIQLPPV